MTRSFKREFPPVDWVPQPKHVLPDGNMLLIHTHTHRRTSRKLDGLTPGEFDVAPLCFTSKLLITDQVRGPAHHLHQSSADLRCVNEWRGVLHTGDWAWIFFFFMCLFSKWRATVRLHIYPNVSHFNGWCTNAGLSPALCGSWGQACCCHPAVRR